ncbi:hypothetical protein B0H16DRAFT_1885894 [Mycena metata]|uniref:Uncharacterized protein n=1 Tax=Mycena metata TaxID=1033252 RepID=A0AAD7J7A9_9AGAR|nr:hypothetical protein B0H16DRAFT_1885894 [Mycena metata]
MCTTTTSTTPVVQRVAETSISAVVNTHESAAAQPINHVGPQCAACGWRGGEHANNCPWK